MPARDLCRVARIPMMGQHVTGLVRSGLRNLWAGDSHYEGNSIRMKITFVWLTLFTRTIVGFMWLMAGWDKVFRLTPSAHAEQFFTGPYADTWLPQWLLWLGSVSIPFVELIGGLLLVLGLFRRPTAVGLGFLLCLVTYGHLLLAPLFVISDHILPRTLLLIPTWVFGVDDDPWSLDGLLARRLSGKRGG